MLVAGASVARALFEAQLQSHLFPWVVGALRAVGQVHAVRIAGGRRSRRCHWFACTGTRLQASRVISQRPRPGISAGVGDLSQSPMADLTHGSHCTQGEVRAARRRTDGHRRSQILGRLGRLPSPLRPAPTGRVLVEAGVRYDGDIVLLRKQRLR